MSKNMEFYDDDNNPANMIRRVFEPTDTLKKAMSSMDIDSSRHSDIDIDLKKLDYRNYNYADFKYEKLKEEIENFQNNLSDEFDVMVQMATFGKEIIMLVEGIGYQNPDLLYFYGKIGDQKAQLIQHHSQLNFLLLASKKEDPKKKGHRIGFIRDDDE